MADPLRKAYQYMKWVGQDLRFMDSSPVGPSAGTPAIVYEFLTQPGVLTGAPQTLKDFKLMVDQIASYKNPGLVVYSNSPAYIAHRGDLRAGLYMAAALLAVVAFECAG
jgi:hypothetical protein